MQNIIEYEFSVAMQWFSAIASAIGKQKLTVIKDCKEQCPTAWALLITYLNPYSVFHVRARSFENAVDPGGEPYLTAKELLDSLLQVASVTNKHMARIKTTLNAVSNEEVRHFIVSYITKAYTLGVTADSINKAVGEKIIPTFSCMLAHKFFDHPQAIVGKTIAVTEKLDGVRAVSVVLVWPEHVDVWLCSRQGKRINGLVEVEAAVRSAVVNMQQAGNQLASFVLDGELLITDRADIPSKEQYKQTTKIVGADKLAVKTGITYNVFDMLPLSEFNLGMSEALYSERRKALETLFRGCNSPSVRVVPIAQTFSYTDEDRALRAVLRLVEEARSEGKEGIMLNDCAAPYVCKRTKNLLKVKVFQDCDVQIVGFQQGTGKYADTLGALIVDYKGTCVGVGSGLSDEQRHEFWNNQDDYRGRVVTVQYFEETCDADGNPSMRFPVFKELREDGKEISYS